MITDIDDFFTRGCGRCARFGTPDCSVHLWDEELAMLRGICLSTGLDETVKWGHPCYIHSGRNIALLGAFRGDVRVSFLNAGLLKDPDKVLEPQGPNSRTPSVMRFTGTEQIEDRTPVIRAYLHEAMGYAEAGMKPEPAVRELILPDELVEALDADPEMAEAFHDLTPGRQRSYVIALSSAKTAETRVRRIGKFRDKVLAGKGAQER